MSKTETKSTVLLKHHLKALKLPTMLAEAEKIAQRCAADISDEQSSNDFGWESHPWGKRVVPRLGSRWTGSFPNVCHLWRFVCFRDGVATQRMP